MATAPGSPASAPPSCGRSPGNEPHVRRMIFSALLIAAAFQGTTGNAGQHQPDCVEQPTQLDMNFCAGIEFGRADDELNREWREQVRGARAADAERDGPAISQYDALLESQ